MSHALTGIIEAEAFRPRRGKPSIEQIDDVIAKHSGLTSEELEFITTYAVKYRTGRDATDEDEP